MSWLIRGTKKGDLRVETEKRKWQKSVTLIKQVEKEPEELLKYLKGKLGCGGTVAGSTVEIQGDHTEVIKSILLEKPDRLRDVKLPKKEVAPTKDGAEGANDEPVGRVRRKPRHAKPEEKAPAIPPASLKRPTGPVINSKPRCPCDWLYCSGWCFEPDSVDDPDYSLMRDKLGMSWLLDDEVASADSKPISSPDLGHMNSETIERALKALGMISEGCACDDGTASLRFVSKRKNKVQKRQLERQMENEAASAPVRREVRERNRTQPVTTTATRPVFASNSRPSKQGARAAMATAHQRAAARARTAQRPALVEDDEFFDAHDEGYLFDEDEDEDVSKQTASKQRSATLHSKRAVPHYIPGYGYQETGDRQQRQKQRREEDTSRAGWDNYQGDGGAAWEDFQGDAPGWDFGGQGDAPGWDANGPGVDPAEAHQEYPDLAEVDEALNLDRIMAESKESAKLESERMRRRQAREDEALRQVLLASEREDAGNSPDDEALRMALLASQSSPSHGKSREEEEEEEAALRWALEQSQKEPVCPPPPTDEDEEEALRWALEQSQSEAARPLPPADQDEEEALSRALAESKSLAAREHGAYNEREDELRRALADSARQASQGLDSHSGLNRQGGFGGGGGGGGAGGGGGDGAGSFGRSYGGGAVGNADRRVLNADVYLEEPDELDDYFDAADTDGRDDVLSADGARGRSGGGAVEEEHSYEEATEVLLRMGFEPDRIRRVLVSAHGDLAYSMETLLAGLDDDVDEEGGDLAAEEPLVTDYAFRAAAAVQEDEDEEEFLIFERSSHSDSFDRWFLGYLSTIGCCDSAYFSYLQSFLAECEAKDTKEGRDPRCDDDAFYDRVAEFTELVSEVLHEQFGGSALKAQVFCSEVARRYYRRDRTGVS